MNPPFAEKENEPTIQRTRRTHHSTKKKNPPFKDKEEPTIQIKKRTHH
jgi:hypothetical protein